MEEKIYTISQISLQTGIPSVTIRAWERRYGLLKPTRTEKGYRLYSQKDIDRIHTVLHYINKGVAVSKVKALLDGKIAISEPEESVWQSHLDQMVAVIERYDQKALDSIYSNLLLVYPIEIITTQLLSPLWKLLAQRWELKYKGAIAEEHFFSTYMRNKLGTHFQHLMTHSKGNRLLFACLPNETHDFALLLFAIYLMQHDYEVIFLGASTPIEEIFIAAKHSEVRGVVLHGKFEGKVMQEMDSEIENYNLPVFGYMKNPLTGFDPKIIQLTSDFSESFEIIHNTLK